jgi:small subunit ribosomal protein S4e
MARGPKKHMKRLATPRAWMLSKLGGIYATRSRCGPHRLRQSIPISVVLRHHLKFALTRREAMMICREKGGNIYVDNRVMKDAKFPLGFMDCLSIPKIKKDYRVLIDVKGRFVLREIS